MKDDTDRELRRRMDAARSRAEMAGRHLLQDFSEVRRQMTPEGVRKVPLFLVPRLFVETGRGDPKHWLEFRMGRDRLYVLQNLQELMQRAESGEYWELGKNAVYLPQEVGWADPVSAALFDLMQKAYREEKGFFAAQQEVSGWLRQYPSYVFRKKRFFLSDTEFARFLHVMGDMPFELHLDGSEGFDARFSREKPPLKLIVARDGEGGTVRLEPQDLLLFDGQGRFVYAGERIYELSANDARALKPLVWALHNVPGIAFDRRGMARFFGEVLPALRDAAELQADPELLREFLLRPLHAAVYIDYEGRGISVRPVWQYGGDRINPFVPPETQGKTGPVYVRDRQHEDELLAQLRSYGFRQRGGRLVLDDEDMSYEFLTDGLKLLPDWVDVFYAETLTRLPVQNRVSVKAGVTVNADNMLELTFDLKSIDWDELQAVFDAYRKKRRYCRLKDRTFVTLGDQQMRDLAKLSERLDWKKAPRHRDDSGKETLELPLSQALYLDGSFAEQERRSGKEILARSRRFRDLRKQLESPQDAPFPVPQTLQPVLRNYQAAGYKWLATLASLGLGGILADDMGLGKTLQVLTLLLAEKERQLADKTDTVDMSTESDQNAVDVSNDAKNSPKKPSIVVAPTSLLYNWTDEAAKFTPQLRVAAAAGTKAERRKVLDHASNYDLIVTTYPLLKRDLPLYADLTFHYCFLDEAQQIKNPGTQNAKAVKELRAEGRFALTGTPIENTLTELWSIFDYLLPGFLYRHETFKRRFEVPIVRVEDESVLKDLRRRVSPFILRRLKSDVLQELPDKTERRVLADMTPRQAKIYQSYFLHSKREFLRVLEQHGFDGSRIKILALLTRLRQIACDPGLFLDDYDGGSGKLDLFDEIVADAVESGHRLLVFSQFTQMLARLGKRLQALGIAYLYLDGSTPAQERVELVKEFNEGTVPVFFISLKAGGTGLNLTGADMVIHFDPWWNPAVEDQATDRAYRIGQMKNVQVLKFLARGTIEEKIYAMQQKKHELIDQMLTSGGGAVRLTEDEVRRLFL